MRIFTEVKTYIGSDPVVLSLGNFDGLHRGHQYILQKNMALATKKGGRSVVLSFSPHPMLVLKPDSFCSLSSPKDQELGLEQLGIDDWVIEPFTDSVRSESAEIFFERLRKAMPISAIVVGPAFPLQRMKTPLIFLTHFSRQSHISLQLLLPMHLYLATLVAVQQLTQE